MKKLRMVVALLLIGLGMLPALPVYAADSAKASVCEGIGLTASSGNCTGDANTQSVNGVIGSVVNILSLIIGVAAVIMILVGGFKYVTAGGDTNAVGSAKSTITYAVVGLIIAAVAQVVVRFVLHKAATT
ncbi:hypothetical protein BH10PAT3_BH10PAT3_5480 [soil metagenome]